MASPASAAAQRAAPPAAAGAGGVPAGSRFGAKRPGGLRLAPSIGDLVFIAIAATCALLLGGLLFRGDGDLGRHLRVGTEILRHGFFFQDRFSHTRAGAPFVPYEWLSEILFAGAFAAAGLAGVVVLTAAVIAAAHALVTMFVLRSGATPVVALAAGLVSVVVGWVHWAARPHAFTLLAVPLLLFILEERRWRPLATALLFALWANLHGGFLFGLVVVALYLAGSLVERDRDSVRRLALTLLVAAAACLLNPAGPGLFLHVVGWFRETAVIDNTMEYLSPNFHDPGPKPFLLALLAAMLLLARSAREMPPRRLAVVLAATAFALLSRRNISLFAVSAIPLLALQLPAVDGRLSRILRTGEARSRPGAWAALFLAALAVAAVPRASGGPGRVHASFDAGRYPVDAVARARAAGLSGRMFNDMSWGGYILWAWPEQRVFIDGQTDFYGSELFSEHQTVMLADPGWQRILEDAGVSLILVPAGWRLVDAALATGRWRVWYRDGTAALLLRSDAAPRGPPG